MSGASYSPNNAIGEARMRIHWCRWGGGADPGCTHVWALDDAIGIISKQCVTDDFGNLVPAVQA